MTNKKKILLIVPTLYSGGGQKLVVDLAINLNKDLFDVIVLSLHPSSNSNFEQYLLRKKVKIEFLDKKKGINFKVIKQLWCFIKKNKPDIVHTHLDIIIYTLIPTILLNIPKRIHTIHTMPWRESSGIKKRINAIAYKYLGFKPVFISDLNKEQGIKEYNLSNRQVAMIYNGVDTSIFSNLDKRKKTDKKIKLICVARFEPVKNHELLIESFEKAWIKNNRLELHLIGDGYLKEEIIAIVKRKKLCNSIFFEGLIADVSEKLRDSDIYILSSDVEGLPISVLEAMASELPIITTAAGGVVDIVTDGENGYVTPVKNSDLLAQSILKLADNPKLRMKMSENSRLKSKKFDIKNCTLEYEKLYLDN